MTPKSPKWIRFLLFALLIAAASFATSAFSEVNISPNMSLPVPIVGVTSGPDYATDINSCMSLIDAHDHSPGYGVQVPSAGININADLTFGSFNLTHLRAARYTPATISCGGAEIDELFVHGVDLYYCDGSGNSVQITSGGGVIGTPGSITGLVAPASAVYSTISGTFTWSSAANTAAAMNQGATAICDTGASPKCTTLQAAHVLGANYTLTLPTALPATNALSQVSTAGAMSYALGVQYQGTQGVLSYKGASGSSGALVGQVAGPVTNFDLEVRNRDNGAIVFYTSDTAYGEFTPAGLFEVFSLSTSNGVVMNNSSGALSDVPGVTYQGTQGIMKFTGAAGGSTGAVFGQFTGANGTKDAIIENNDNAAVDFYPNATYAGAFLASGTFYVVGTANIGTTLQIAGATGPQLTNSTGNLVFANPNTGNQLIFTGATAADSGTSPICCGSHGPAGLGATAPAGWEQFSIGGVTHYRPYW